MEHNPGVLVVLWRRRAMLGLLALLVPALLMAGVAFADTSYTVQPGDTLSGIAAQHGVTVEAIMVANNLDSRSLIFAGQVLTIPSPGSTPAPPTPVPTTPGTGPTAVRTALPTSAARTPTISTYVVQEGDHLTGLAAQFGLSRAELAAANGLDPSSLLYVGQVLKIPAPGQALPRPTAAAGATRTTLAGPGPTSGIRTGTGTPAAMPAPGKPIKYTVQTGDNLSSIALKFNTTVTALIDLNGFLDGNFLAAGQTIDVVPGDPTKVKTPTPKPEVKTPIGKYGPKWIDVDLSTQTLVVYEGQIPVLTTRVSSGLGRTPTVTGTYRVYLKYRSQTMRGNILGEQYEVPNVPDVMYFYSGYALHGAYWHNNFGRPMSHGCVNLPLGIAKQLFAWAPEGTIVRVHQ